MKKTLTLFICIAFLFTGCGYNAKQQQTTTGAVKTGYAVISAAGKSTDASDKDGLAQVDTTIVAVTADNSGKITKCFIDGIQTKVNFSSVGKIITPLDTLFKTKLEMGTDYGMKKASSIGKEWSEQAAALSDYAVGKTVEQIKGIAVNETGNPTASELKSSVTMSITSYINGIEKAVANAKDFGAKAGDKLGMGAVTNIAKSKDATAQGEGFAQAYSSYTVATFDANGKVTSCIIDGSQTNVKISAAGKITSDKNEVAKTKNELAENYNMKSASSIGKEWYEQAAFLSKYFTGKTVDDVKNIAINEKGSPTENELKSSVTISISDYVDALEKAKANSK